MKQALNFNINPISMNCNNTYNHKLLENKFAEPLICCA